MQRQAPLSVLHQARRWTRTQGRLSAAFPRAKRPELLAGGPAAIDAHAHLWRGVHAAAPAVTARRDLAAIV